ncbi:hypothetical protein P9112_001889 [Eukaryota sp. TZLM1-RC]
MISVPFSDLELELSRILLRRRSLLRPCTQTGGVCASGHVSCGHCPSSKKGCKRIPSEDGFSITDDHSVNQLVQALGHPF